MAIYLVTNRSASQVIYRIPEDNIRREFAPRETKKISGEELEKLTFQAGGREILANFLQIQNEQELDNLNIAVEPEYFMTEEQVIELIKNGSVDAFTDALNFAPIGVIDLIKDLSVKLPLENTEKKKVLKEITGFNLDKALENLEAEREASKPAAAAKSDKSAATPAAPTAPAGRKTNPNYKVVKKD